MAVSSLKAQFRVGPGLGFVTETRTLLLNASANFDLPANYGLLGEYNYIFAKTSSNTWWGLDLCGTYTFVNLKALGKLYGLAGLNLLYRTNNGYKSNYTGVDVGAGYRVGIGNMELVPEAIITVGSLSYLRLGVKLMFGL